ncbi:hypothetical protein GCM10022237_04180 [Nocardioides ginsengisoli]|uniref:Uncharacterized protein n=1 Tax=Nocardioides ginsengisoli TaxID=363868 RepID=A0ABW3VVP9_9ACTN
MAEVLTDDVSSVVERASDLAYVKERLAVHAELLDAVASREEARAREAAEAHRFMRHTNEDAAHAGT